MIRYSHSGLWPTLSHINKFNWGKRIDDSESDHGTTGHVKKGSNECTLAQTLPSLCTISAKHGFLLVPEHTDERRVSQIILLGHPLTGFDIPLRGFHHLIGCTLLFKITK